MFDDKACRAVRADVRGHSLAKIKTRPPRLWAFNGIAVGELIAYRVAAVQATIGNAAEAVRIKEEIDAPVQR